MTFPTLNLFFPIILAAHNADEYFRFDEFVPVYQGRIPARLITRRVFRDAAILLTLTAFAVSVATYFHANGAWVRLSMIATLAMAFNGLTHGVLSLRKGALTPGTRSGIVLILPYSVVAITVMRKTMGASWKLLLGCTVLGAVLTPVAVGLFLLLGYGLSLLVNRMTRLFPA